MDMQLSTSPVVDSENYFCIHTSLLDTVIRTDYAEFSELIDKAFEEPDHYYAPWGGKCGFLESLGKRLLAEYEYFEENLDEADQRNTRYADFISDQVYYEAFKTALIGEPVKVIDPEHFVDVGVAVSQ